MKPTRFWAEGMSAEETINIAYWERNMLALTMAIPMSKWICPGTTDDPAAGWYRHEGGGYEGWSRIISLYGGCVTFHVPDDFDLSLLPEIKPNWDGHTTEQKWQYIEEANRFTAGGDEPLIRLEPNANVKKPAPIVKEPTGERLMFGRVPLGNYWITVKTHEDVSEEEVINALIGALNETKSKGRNEEQPDDYMTVEEANKRLANDEPTELVGDYSLTVNLYDGFITIGDEGIVVDASEITALITLLHEAKDILELKQEERANG